MADQSGKLVLVVEDDPDIREAICLLLEYEGYTVRSAENGAVATRLLHDGPAPALVLTDLMMPVMNGWELIRALRASDLADVPVVVVSATVDGRLPEDIEHLRKPVDADELLHTIERAASQQ